jgi:hypothetical protein
MSCKGGKASVISPRLRGSAYVVNPELRGSATKINQSLMGTAKLARCDDGTYYLRVTPSVVWLSSDAVGSATFKVKSNTNWQIK